MPLKEGEFIESNMARRGTKRKEPDPSAESVSETITSGAIIANDEVANDMPTLPPEQRWEPTYPDTAIAANASQDHNMNTAESEMNAQMHHAPEMQPHTMTPEELSHYQYHEFLDWLNRWHIYQHSLSNYWREYNNDAFNRKWIELAEYKQTHGDCNVPSDYVGDEPLGKWVERMRAEAKDGRLDMAKIEQLRSLGFDFDGDDK